MKYRLLGKSGLKVSEFSLGILGFGDNKQDDKQVFDMYANMGGNFLDTSSFYNGGKSEMALKDLLAADRDHFVVATKYTNHDDPNDIAKMGNNRKNMMRQVEQSLKRIGTDYIDVLYLHAWDYTTPIEEVMRGFNDLVSSGKVHYIGVSDTPAWVIAKANAIADFHGWSRFIVNTIEYSLIERSSEHELIPMSKDDEIGITAWSPLAQGVLTGKYHDGSAGVKRLDNVEQKRYFDVRAQRIVAKVVETAKRLGTTPSRVAQAWIVHKDPSIIPVLGASKPKYAEDNFGYLDVKIPAELMAELELVSAIEPIFPANFVDTMGVFPVHGNTFGQVEGLRRY